MASRSVQAEAANRPNHRHGGDAWTEVQQRTTSHLDSEVVSQLVAGGSICALQLSLAARAACPLLPAASSALCCCSARNGPALALGVRAFSF
jgi:hypothetical protein